MNNDDYSLRQAARDRAYLDAWSSDEAKAWLDSLSLQERRELESVGLLQPVLDKVRSTGTATLDRDVADSYLACESVDFAAAVDGPEELDEATGNPAKASFYQALETIYARREGEGSPGPNPASRNGSAGGGPTPQDFDEKLWDVLRRVMGELLSAPNRSLTLECMAAVSGLSYTGDSFTDIAKRHRVSRAAVSKRCIELTERLGLPPSRAMRSLTARKAYRHAQLRRHRSDEQP
jgi:hypothetical protein